MLIPAPNQRFQSAQEVMAALTASRTTPSPQQLPQAQPSQSPPVTRSVRSAFSTLELLAGAAFSGFEGGLIAIALASLLGTTLISTGLWLLILGGLILAQSLRIIEKADKSNYC